MGARATGRRHWCGHYPVGPSPPVMSGGAAHDARVRRSPAGGRPVTGSRRTP